MANLTLPAPKIMLTPDGGNGLGNGARLGVGEVCATAEASAGLGEGPHALGGPVAHPTRMPIASTVAAAPAATISVRELTERP